MTTKKAVDVGAIALRATAHPAPPPQPHARPIKDAMATDPHVRMEIVRSAHGKEVIAHQVIGPHAVMETAPLPHAVMETAPLPRAVTDPLTATG